MSKQVTEWLEQLGLDKYISVFVENDIREDILTELTESDLKSLGITSLGHRKILLRAIEALKTESPASLTPQVELSPNTPDNSGNPDAERRQLTVMFCDLVGSTELSQQLDPEDLRDVNRAYQDACKFAIKRFDGFVARYMGDGVLAYFGYPNAHEDDAERAVRAGVALMEQMNALNEGDVRRRQLDLAVRVGIATGQVVVGDLIGEGASQESAVVGETPNLAARLQNLAKPNTLVVSSGTKRLLGDVFEFRNAGEHTLKGITSPVQVWEIAGDSKIESRFRAMRGSRLTPLIGRDAELELLLSRWRRATEREGQLILLSGEPGIGKSRLIEDLMERAKTNPHVPIRYYCSPFHADSALHPVIRQLERDAGFVKTDSTSQRLAKLGSLSIQDEHQPGEALSMIAALFSIPTDDADRLSRLTPQAQKARTLDTLVKYVERAAENLPVLMVVEDAHWLDPTTTELLGQIMNVVHDLPVFILVSYRPEFVPPWMGFAAPVTLLTLSRLGRSESMEVVERIIGGKTLPASTMAQILDKTDGIPLFVEEFTKSMLESDLFVDESQRNDSLLSPPEVIVPATLHDSLMSRLDRDTAVKELAQIGAVIGREFSFELLAALNPVSKDVLKGNLSKLLESELVFCKGVPPEAIYNFKHALVQDAAYQSLLKSKRRRLHAQVGEILEKLFPKISDTEPELPAQHFIAAELPAKAIPYCLNAGRKALLGFNLTEAISHLSKALELTAKIDDQHARAERELEARTALGAATMALHGWAVPKLGNILKPACELVESGRGRSDAFMNLWNLWLNHACRAEHREGLSVVDRMLSLADRRNDPVVTLVSSFTAAKANYWVGNYGAAKAYESTALKIYDFERDRILARSYNHDPKTALLSWASQREWALGYPDKARALSEEAVTHARTVNHAFDLCWVLGNSSVAYSNCGDYAKACARIEQLRDTAQEQNLSFMENYMVPVEICMAAAQAGEFETAYVQGGLANKAWESIGGRFWVPIVKAYMAFSCLRLGRTEEAMSLIEEAISQMEATEELMLAEEIYRIAGLVHYEHRKDHRIAEDFFQKSFDFSQEHGTMSFKLRTSMSLARLWSEQGKRRDAHDLLAPVYDWFTEGFDTSDLKDARALLVELR